MPDESSNASGPIRRETATEHRDNFALSDSHQLSISRAPLLPHNSYMNDHKLPETVMITGASAGVGRATAREFAKYDCRIGLIARGRDGLEGAKRDVEELGGKAIVLPADVSDYDAVDAAADQLEKAFGPIDIWVNNAMVSVFAPVIKMTADEYRRVTEVTYLGQVHGTLAALKRMRPRDRGSIVLVGSALAYRGIPLQSAYCASKHAIQGFFDSLRTELLHDKSNVKVTMVNLPGVNTTQFEWVRDKMPNKPQPLGGSMFQPEVPARAIYWAAHHSRRELNVAYPTLKAIYGNMIAPNYADHVLARNGYQGQQTDQPVSPDHQDNLLNPVPGDHGAHGPFDDKACSHAPLLWADMNRQWLALAGAGVAGIVAGRLL
jgi:short-subunit dehydrogenase